MKAGQGAKERDLMRLAATVESISDMVLIADLEDRIVYVNPAAIEKLGYTRQELLGKTSEFFVSPNNSPGLMEHVMKATFAGGWCGEILNVTKSGHEFTTFLRTAVVRNSAGEPIGLTGISRDITDLKKAQKKIQNYTEKLKEANRQLKKAQNRLVQQEKMAALGVLSSGIAHEIGNPLASISSLVQLLERKTMDETTLDTLRVIANHIHRINRIIRQIGDFSHGSRGKMEYCDVFLLLKEALGWVGYDRRRKDIKLDLNVPLNIPKVYVVPDQLIQVFKNIVLNAFDAIENEGEIRIKSFVQDGKLKICFQDNGRGIPEEILPKIFEPFFTTKETGRGAGLGLAMSYSLIKSFDGELFVKSRVNEGTTFEIRLPIFNKEKIHETVSNSRRRR